MTRTGWLVVGLMLWAGSVAAQKDSTVCVKCVATFADSQTTVRDSTPSGWDYTTTRTVWRVYSWRDSIVKVTPPVTPPDTQPTPIPPAPGEPSAAGHALIRADNFDAYTGSRPGKPWDCTPGSTDVSMVAGRSGKAFQLNYTPSAFYSGCDLGFSETKGIGVSYWFRIAPTGYDVVENDGTGSGMKWFTLWRPSDPRQTWGANHLGVNATTFGTHDNSSSNMPNPVNGPAGLWNKVSDGQWHRYTIEAVTGNAGYEKCWLDGVLIFNTTGKGYARSSQGFSLLQIGHDKVRAPSKNFQILIDDFTAWVP